MKDTGRDGKRKGTGLKKKDEAENARLCRETAVLGGDAMARAKVGSEGGVEVAAKTRGGGEDRGYETAFLKMRVGALVAPRAAGGRGESRLCKDCGKKRSPWGGAGTHRGCGRDSRGGERVERRKEWVRIELILFHGPRHYFPLLPSDSWPNSSRCHPLSLFQARAIYLAAVVYVGTRKRRHVLLRHSASTHVDSFALLVRSLLPVIFLSTPVESVGTNITEITMKRDSLLGFLARLLRPRKTRPIDASNEQ